MSGPDNLFRRYLLSREHLLWTGRPNPYALFTRSDLFLVPFSVMWAGFAIFWEHGVIVEHAPLFMRLWGIPFILLGAYITVGRFVYKYIAQQRTYYAVTNQRILVLTTLFQHRLQAAIIRTLPTMSMSVSAHGGTVQFGQPSPYGSWFANTGWGFFQPSGVDSLAFYNIPDPQYVYDLISRQAVDERAP